MVHEVDGFVVDPIEKNVFKHYQQPLPFFDIEDYPFVMTSGNISYNSINVKELNNQAIAYGTSSAGFGQQPFCFMQEDGDWGIHFATQGVNTKLEIEFRWYCMTPREDLM